MTDPSPPDARPPSLLKIIGSVLASFFGVQSSRQHEADFTRGRPMAYILVGVGATLLFILTVWGVVKLVVSSATGQ
jgi:hypothetical protein